MSGWSRGWAGWAAVFETALAESGVPDWERHMVRDAGRVEAGFRERYIRVPQAESREFNADMEAFIETVGNARLRDGLGRATHSEGRGAFRRFKTVLLDAPAERERWFAFRDARQRARWSGCVPKGSSQVVSYLRVARRSCSTSAYVSWMPARRCSSKIRR